MSSKKNPAIALITLAALESEEQKIQQQLAALTARKAEIQQAELDKVGDTVKGFPAQIKAITGREVSMSDLINLIKRVETGTLGKLSAGVNHGQHAKRLTEAEEATVREFVISREVDIAMGRPGGVISQFCAKMDISTQTYDARRKRFAADETAKAEVANRINVAKAAAVPAVATA